MNGMKVSNDTLSPWRRASTTWPSSCTRSMRTNPSANVQLWNHSVYAATEMKKPKNLTKTKPHLSAVPPINTARPPARSSERRRLPFGWIGCSVRNSSIPGSLGWNPEAPGGVTVVSLRRKGGPMLRRLVVLAALVLPSSALAAYPTPYAQQGNPGVLSPDGTVRFVAYDAPGPTTILAAVNAADGSRLRSSTLP